MYLRWRVPLKICASIFLGFCFALGSIGQEGAQKPSIAQLAEKPIAVGGGEIGNLLKKWYSEGTAAGNVGDYYDNRDNGHSSLNMGRYPQLQKTEYSKEQIKARQNWALQRKILPHVVFGNSSTSASPRSGGSNIRSYYTNPDGMKFLYTQYVRNNLYIYPEHGDHDPGHNGNGGYGDLFPTNTPYLIASQGSSSSDRRFMTAMPYVLAAFRPEVKKKLIQSGLLMPTIQMILRITNKHIKNPEEYLTGKAHPSVFRGSWIDAKKMVTMAHEITLSEIPPIALLKILKEDSPTNGIDYFEPELTERLGDTPAVIARIFRGAPRDRKITVSARESSDLNNRPLQFFWVILRGEPDKIKIDYVNPSHSIAEITVSYLHRRPIAEGSDLESNRIDIGVFVHNGVYYSPPAFITFYSLDNEARTYRTDGRPLEIAYGAGTSTISIADWEAFFNVLNPRKDSWPCRFLQRQFKTRELAVLTEVSEEFHNTRATLRVAQKEQEEADTAYKAAKDAVKAIEEKKAVAEKEYRAGKHEDTKAALVNISEELEAAIKARKEAATAFRTAGLSVDAAKNSEEQALEKKRQVLNLGTAAFVKRTLNSMLEDPSLWIADAEELVTLLKSADNKAREEFNKAKKTLVSFGVAEDSQSFSLRITPIRKGNNPLKERLTHYEKEMIKYLNAIALSRIILPGIVTGDWQENYVDHRIASAKEWRDVYRYAPDGTPMGWLRYQSEGIREFNAEGLLVLEKDSQGRCTRARVVRYELEPQRTDSRGRSIGTLMPKVEVILTNTLREYEYAGPNDWRGHIKR